MYSLTPYSGGVQNFDVEWVGLNCVSWKYLSPRFASPKILIHSKLRWNLFCSSFSVLIIPGKEEEDENSVITHNGHFWVLTDYISTNLERRVLVLVSTFRYKWQIPVTYHLICISCIVLLYHEPLNRTSCIIEYYYIDYIVFYGCIFDQYSIVRSAAVSRFEFSIFHISRLERLLFFLAWRRPITLSSPITQIIIIIHQIPAAILPSDVHWQHNNYRLLLCSIYLTVNSLQFTLISLPKTIYWLYSALQSIATCTHPRPRRLNAQRVRRHPKRNFTRSLIGPYVRWLNRNRWPRRQDYQAPDDCLPAAVHAAVAFGRNERVFDRRGRRPGLERLRFAHAGCVDQRCSFGYRFKPQFLSVTRTFSI